MRWYLRLQLGQQLLGQAVQIAMLSLAVADRVGGWLGIPAFLAAIGVPVIVLGGLLAVGTVLDWCHWVQRQDEQGRIRSGSWERSYANQERILQAVERIEESLCEQR